MKCGNIILPWGRDAVDTLLVLKVFERCISGQIFLLDINHLLSFWTRSKPVWGWCRYLIWWWHHVALYLLPLLSLYFLISFTGTAVIALGRSSVYKSIVVWFIRLFLKRWFIWVLLLSTVSFELQRLTGPIMLVDNVPERILLSSRSFSWF